MGSNSLLRPYYYGERSWDRYLLDIQEAVEEGNRLRTKTLEVSQEQSAELRRQTAEYVRVHETLQDGLDEMRSEFQWGFSLIVDRMDRQIALVTKVVAKLDEIHKTLRSPLMTQARELFQIGRERTSKALLDKALEAFLQSEQKN